MDDNGKEVFRIANAFMAYGNFIVIFIMCWRLKLIYIKSFKKFQFSR